MARLNFPPGAKCQVPGCNAKPTHVLSLRMRRQDTGADWAPNTEAFFCLHHAVDGANIEILYEPLPTRLIKTVVHVIGEGASRITAIK